MLVLTRKRSEMIQVGNDIVIKIIQTGKSSVKIGIEAPSHVRVLRSELEPHQTVEPQKAVEVSTDFLLKRLQERHTRLPEAVAVQHVVEATPS